MTVTVQQSAADARPVILMPNHPDYNRAAQHFPASPLTLVVKPDADHPKSPVVVQAMCTCGDDECYWTWTAYDPVNVQPQRH